MPVERKRGAVDVARARAALALRSQVAGSNPDARAARVWGVSGPRWFTPADPIWRVHADASMFVGGIRSLLLQSLHPLAMAGVDQHSSYQSDPWTRVQNTSGFITMTTFGTIANAEQSIAAVRAIHDRVHGVAADGRTYDANDPHLLLWVHVAEIETFLTCYQAYGRAPLSAADADTYVAQTAVVATKLGVVDPPMSVAELTATIAAFRPELTLTPGAAAACRFLRRETPLPWTAKPPYAALVSAAVATLPAWARELLELPVHPARDAATIRLVGRPAVATVRWLLDHPSVAKDRVLGHADR